MINVCVHVLCVTCVHVHMCICTQLYVYVYTYTFMQIYAYSCTYICRHVHVQTCIQICVYVYMNMYMYCMHVHVCLLMLMYIQIGIIRNKQRLNYEAVQMKSFFIFFHCIYTCIQCDVVNVTCTKEQSQQMALQTADHVNSVNTVASYMYVAVYKSSEVSMGIL